MHYKGTGKHSVEDLEEIIDEIQSQFFRAGFFGSEISHQRQPME